VRQERPRLRKAGTDEGTEPPVPAAGGATAAAHNTRAERVMLSVCTQCLPPLNQPTLTAP